MKIDISEIKGIKNALMNIDETDSAKILENSSEEFKFDGEINFSGTAENIDGSIRIKGLLKADYSTKCFRCLNDIKRHIEINIKETFTAETGGYKDSYPLNGDILSFDDAIRDNIFLNLPMKVICEEECKGLCPSCGKDLNKESCNCSNRMTDPRMDKLKDLLK